MDKICNSCGTDLQHFYKTGMLGYPQCYNVFRNEIKQTLGSIQGNSFHVGKKPTLDEKEKELIKYYHKLIEERDRASLEGRFADMTQLGLMVTELREELKEMGLL